MSGRGERVEMEAEFKWREEREGKTEGKKGKIKEKGGWVGMQNREGQEAFEWH